jgi:hypothetical protein
MEGRAGEDAALIIRPLSIVPAEMRGPVKRPLPD